MVVGEVEVAEGRGGGIEVATGGVGRTAAQEGLGPIELRAGDPRGRAKAFVLTDCVGEQRVGLLVLAEPIEQERPEAVSGPEVDPACEQMNAGLQLQNGVEGLPLLIGAEGGGHLAPERDNDGMTSVVGELVDSDEVEGARRGSVITRREPDESGKRTRRP